MKLLLILIIFLNFGCQTTIEKFNLPPTPERPELKSPKTTADLYVIVRDLMIYGEEWESWGKNVIDLTQIEK